MFAKAFKLVFGVGAAVVATCALAVAAIGIFWLISYWVTNPTELARQEASELANQISTINGWKADLCANVPPKENRFLEYMDAEPADAAHTMTTAQLEARRAYAIANAKNRNFTAIARDYCQNPIK